MSTNLSRYVDSPVGRSLFHNSQFACNTNTWPMFRRFLESSGVFKFSQRLMPFLPPSVHPFLFPSISSSCPPFPSLPTFLPSHSSKIIQQYNRVAFTSFYPMSVLVSYLSVYTLLLFSIPSSETGPGVTQTKFVLKS